MIHINRGNMPHECLTDDEFKERYPELHDSINQPRPWEYMGNALSRERRCAGITIRELAKRLNMTMTDLSAIETGRVEPTNKFMSRYCEAIRAKAKGE